VSGRTQDPDGRLLVFVYRAITLFRSASQLIQLTNNFVTPQYQSYNPKVQALWFGLFRVRSPLLTESIFLSIPVANEMFQFTTSTFKLSMYSTVDNLHTQAGFPHSEISGSKLTYSSPEHIGVSPVLHRLLVPRHPPCALNNLTYQLSLMI
jgi:hypothetical protein